MVNREYKQTYTLVNKFSCLIGYNHGCSVIVMTLGQRLKLARSHAGLTQAQLAEKAGVSQQTISNIESGSQDKSSEVVKFAMICCVRAEWLAEEQGEMVDGLYVQDERLKHLIMVCQDLPGYAVDQLVLQGDAMAKLAGQATKK